MEEAMEDRVRTLENAIDVLGEALKENPVSPKCEAVLTASMTKSVCYDFREIRRWVMCKTWALMETEKLPFKDSIKKAWAEARAKCAEVSAAI